SETHMILRSATDCNAGRSSPLTGLYGESSMDLFSDMKIADRVRAAFQQDPLIGRSDIGITVTAGKVYLSGKVDSYFNRLHAQEVASRVAGVIEVRSGGLVVKNALPAKTDGEISEAIQRHFWHAP